MLRCNHLQQIPFITAAVQTCSPLGTPEQFIFRFLYLQCVHVLFWVNGTGIEEEMMRGDCKQWLCKLPARRDQEVLYILRGQNQRGIHFTDTLHRIADILNGRRTVQEQIQFVQHRNAVTHTQQLVVHIREDIELNSTPQLFIQIHNPLNTEDQKLIVSRARKIERFLSQPFHVAEQFTGIEGKYVPLSETIRGFNEILEGKHDNLPEGAFLLVGTIDDAVAKAKAMSEGK